MHVWNMLHAARWKYRTQKWHKKLPSGHHRTTLSGYIFATKARIDNRKKGIKQQYLLHMFLQYGELGPLAAEIVLLVWGTPANFNGFCILASLLQRHCSTEAKQTLQIARCLAVSRAATVYIHFWRQLPRNGILPGAKVILRPPSLALSYWQRYCMALEQWAWAKLCGVEHWARPVFGRATITMRISPHSS